MLVRVFDETGRAYRENSALIELHTERLLIELTVALLPDDLTVGKSTLLANEDD